MPERLRLVQRLVDRDEEALDRGLGVVARRPRVGERQVADLDEVAVERVTKGEIEFFGEQHLAPVEDVSALSVVTRARYPN